MNVERIVIGMDFSESAIATMQWVAGSFGVAADLILVHALEPDRHRPLPPVSYPTSAAAALPEAAAERMREIARLLPRGRTRVIVREGRGYTVLPDVAREVRADLVAVGAHGEGSPRSRLLGTTADRFVRSTRVPVLVGNGPADARVERLVVGVDGGSMTSTVLAWAQYAREAFNARVSVVRAVDDPATVILETAARDQADLIIVGRRAVVAGIPTPLGRTLRHVLHQATCPVLVVTPKEEPLVFHQPDATPGSRADRPPW